MKKSSKRQRRRHNPHTAPLGPSITDRLDPGALGMPIAINKPPQMPRMPSPPRSTRAVLNMLTAATGLMLAAKSDAAIELLPGSPTTVLVVSGGKTQAIFMLPVEHGEVLKALGQREPCAPGADILQLYDDERWAEMTTPEAMLIEAMDAPHEN